MRGLVLYQWVIKLMTVSEVWPGDTFLGEWEEAATAVEQRVSALDVPSDITIKTTALLKFMHGKRYPRSRILVSYSLSHPLMWLKCDFFFLNYGFS